MRNSIVFMYTEIKQLSINTAASQRLYCIYYYIYNRFNVTVEADFMPFIPYFTCFFFQNKLIAYVNQKTTKPLFSELILVPKTVFFLQAETSLYVTKYKLVYLFILCFLVSQQGISSLSFLLGYYL